MQQSWWKWLFTWQGRTGRTEYFLAGVTLAAIKYLTDRSVAAAFGETWQMWAYISASPVLTLLYHDSSHIRMYLALWAIAVPFFWIGIALTLRRLRDAGKRPEWIFLLFLPFMNVALFLWLALAPGKPVESDTAGRPPGLICKVGVPAVLLAAGVGLTFAVLETQSFVDYGFGLFLGVPFVTGFIASWLVNLRAKCSTSETVWASMAPIAVLGLALILFRFEGLICLIMALPLAIPCSITGGLAARDILRRHHDAQSHPVALCIAALPLLMLSEYRAKLDPPVLPVTTSITIHAPASVVWNNVISFPPLAPPSVASVKDWIFVAGIAYPTSGQIVGSGAGAVRYCRFSTGDFVEPVTVWDEDRLLAFDVAAEPPALRELSPWPISPPHLERRYMRSLHGQFRLVALDKDHTLLEGTTWYQNYFWPQMYWREWSDAIVHRIHMRVLEHVKAQAERQAIQTVTH